MTGVEGIIESAVVTVREASAQQTGGKWLENITVLTAPLISEWDVESCYPWAEWPDREFHFPNTTHQDVGIDAVAVRRKMDVRYSITIRQHKSLRHLIEAISEADWTPIPYWMDGAADVAETTYIPFQTEPDAAPVRLIVRRVKPTPGSQLALFASYSYHGFITDRDGETLELEADHRRHAEVENAIRDLKYGVGLNHMPSGGFAANGAWLAVQVMAHNLARWTARIGLGEQVVTTKTLRRRFFSLAGRLTRSARRLTLHLPKRWPWEAQFDRALARLRALPLPA